MISRHIGWWFYFWFIAACLAASLFSGSASAIDLAMVGFGAIALLGLWGYLRHRPIGHRFVWAGMFFLLLLQVLYYALRPFFTETIMGSWIFVVAGISTLLAVPLLLALWRYAFRSTDVWRQPTAA